MKQKLLLSFFSVIVVSLCFGILMLGCENAANSDSDDSEEEETYSTQDPRLIGNWVTETLNIDGVDTDYEYAVTLNSDGSGVEYVYDDYYLDFVVNEVFTWKTNEDKQIQLTGDCEQCNTNYMNYTVSGSGSGSTITITGTDDDGQSINHTFEKI